MPLDSGEGREEGGGQRQLACPICGSEFVEELEPAPTLRAFPDPATNPTRALRIGGNQSPGATNSIEFLTIITTGNGQDFGDLTYATRGVGANSNGHGGL